MIEVIVMLANGIGSGARYVATHFLGMSMSDDVISDLVRQEARAKYSR